MPSFLPVLQGNYQFTSTLTSLNAKDQKREVSCMGLVTGSEWRVFCQYFKEITNLPVPQKKKKICSFPFSRENVALLPWTGKIVDKEGDDERGFRPRRFCSTGHALTWITLLTLARDC